MDRAEEGISELGNRTDKLSSNFQYNVLKNRKSKKEISLIKEFQERLKKMTVTTIEDISGT